MSVTHFHRSVLLGVAGLLLCGVGLARESSREAELAGHDGCAGVIWDGESLRLGESTGSMAKVEGADLPGRLRPLFFQPIPINSADRELLLTVPGIGPATAAGILRLRGERGTIESAEELLLIDGIGPAKQAALGTAFSY